MGAGSCMGRHHGADGRTAGVVPGTGEPANEDAGGGDPATISGGRTRCENARSIALIRTWISPWRPDVGPRIARIPVDDQGRPSQLPVGEHPPVERAPPCDQLGRDRHRVASRHPAQHHERLERRGSVDGGPAMASLGALDQLEAHVLRDRWTLRAPRGDRHGPVHGQCVEAQQAKGVRCAWDPAARHAAATRRHPPGCSR